MEYFKKTRPENLPEHGISYKEVENAKEIRKELKERFPNFKFSVTSKFYGRFGLSIVIKSSPYDENSDIVKAVSSWCKKYIYSYGASTFHTYIDFGYNQKPATKKDMEILNQFNYDLMEFKKEQERLAAIAEQKRKEQERLEKIRYEEWKKQHKKNLEYLEKTVKVKNIEYFLKDVVIPKTCGVSTVSQYLKSLYEDGGYRGIVKIGGEINLNSKQCLALSEMLLDDLTFFAQRGGSHTDDERIQCNDDLYIYKDVEWIDTDCLAIKVDGKITMIVNPQGHSYAKYVYFADSNTHIIDGYKTKTGFRTFAGDGRIYDCLF